MGDMGPAAKGPSSRTTKWSAKRFPSWQQRPAGCNTTMREARQPGARRQTAPTCPPTAVTDLPPDTPATPAVGDEGLETACTATHRARPSASSNGCSDSADEHVSQPRCRVLNASDHWAPAKPRVAVARRAAPSWQRPLVSSGGWERGHPEAPRCSTPRSRRTSSGERAAADQGHLLRGRQESSSLGDEASLSITPGSSSDLDALRVCDPLRSLCGTSSDGRRSENGGVPSDMRTSSGRSSPALRAPAPSLSRPHATQPSRDAWGTGTPRAVAPAKRHVPSWGRAVHAAPCEPPPPPPPPPPPAPAVLSVPPGRLRPQRTGTHRPPSWQTHR
eukprot:EG_transcript_13732